MLLLQVLLHVQRLHCDGFQILWLQGLQLVVGVALIFIVYAHSTGFSTDSTTSEWNQDIVQITCQ